MILLSDDRVGKIQSLQAKFKGNLSELTSDNVQKVNTGIKYAMEALNVNMESGLRAWGDTFPDRDKKMPIGLHKSNK